MTDVDEDILAAGIQTYDLEKQLEPDKDAMAAAFKAMLIKFELQVMNRIADAAEDMATRILDEEDPSEEGAVALELFAAELRESIPPENSYVPETEDIVEVRLVGEVTVYDNECPECGHEQEKTTWSVHDTATGQEYFFDPIESKRLKVRLVSGGLDEYLV